jgi:hypothetical protein
MFFPLQFATLNASHRMSQFSPHSVLLPPGFVAKKQTLTISRLVWKRGQSHSAAEQPRCCTVLTVGKSHTHRTQQMAAWPQSRSPNNYRLRTITHLCRIPTHWHSHSNPNPTTHSLTATFPSLCTSDTHYCTQCILLQGPQSSFYKFACPPCYCYSLRNCHLWRWDDLQMYGIPIS